MLRAMDRKGNERGVVSESPLIPAWCVVWAGGPSATSAAETGSQGGYSRDPGLILPWLEPCCCCLLPVCSWARYLMSQLPSPHLWNRNNDNSGLFVPASLVAQLVKNPPAMRETCVRFLGSWKIPWRRERLPTPGLWPEDFHGLCKVHGVAKSQTQLSNFHFQGCLAISGYKWI